MLGILFFGLVNDFGHLLHSTGLRQSKIFIKSLSASNMYFLRRKLRASYLGGIILLQKDKLSKRISDEKKKESKKKKIKLNIKREKIYVKNKLTKKCLIHNLICVDKSLIKHLLNETAKFSHLLSLFSVTVNPSYALGSCTSMHFFPHPHKL